MTPSLSLWPCQEHHGHEDHSARSQAVRHREVEAVHKGIHWDSLRLGLPLDSRIMRYMCMYIYIYTHVWVDLDIYIYMYILKHIHTCLSICLFTYVFIHITYMMPNVLGIRTFAENWRFHSVSDGGQWPLQHEHRLCGRCHSSCLRGLIHRFCVRQTMHDCRHLVISLYEVMRATSVLGVKA